LGFSAMWKKSLVKQKLGWVAKIHHYGGGGGGGGRKCGIKGKVKKQNKNSPKK